MPTPQRFRALAGALRIRALARAEINVQLFSQSLIFVLTLCVQKCIIYVETPKGDLTWLNLQTLTHESNPS